MKKLTYRQSNESGFTMVELLMTITLIAVLSAIATTSYIDFRNEARTATTNKKIYEIREALVGNPEIIANGQFVKPGVIVDIGSVPADLGVLASQGALSSFNLYEKHGWRGPYIDVTIGTWSQDAWGTALSYSAGARTITSCGVDKTCGNADDITVTF